MRDGPSVDIKVEVHGGNVPVPSHMSFMKHRHFVPRLTDALSLHLHTHTHTHTHTQTERQTDPHKSPCKRPSAIHYQSKRRLCNKQRLKCASNPIPGLSLLFLHHSYMLLLEFTGFFICFLYLSLLRLFTCMEAERYSSTVYIHTAVFSHIHTHTRWGDWGGWGD